MVHDPISGKDIRKGALSGEAGGVGVTEARLDVLTKVAAVPQSFAVDAEAAYSPATHSAFDCSGSIATAE